MFLDIHVHTEEYSSDSDFPLRKILSSAKEMGLSGVCIVDHDTMALYDQAETLSEESGLVVIVGMEYTCREGHLLVFGTPELIKPQLPLGKAIKEIKSQGGVVIAAHPFRWDSLLMEEAMKEHVSELDGIEAFNGGSTTEENINAYKFAKKYELPVFGGSDAHHEIRIAKYVTDFSAPVRNESDFIRLVNKARVAKNGLESIGAAARKGTCFVSAYSHERQLYERMTPPLARSIREVLGTPRNRFSI